MSNEIKPTEEKVLGEFTRAEVATLQSTIAQGTTREQFNLFMQTCVNSGLNPFMNHIYPIVYGGKMTLQVSVEGVLHLARQNPEFEGVESQIVCEKDEFKVERIDSEMKITSHSFGFPRGRVVGAYAIARRKGKKDVVILMEASEVEHLTKGRNKHMWTTYYNDMFRKHVMKRAVKEQFGIELAEDNPPIESGEQETKDITPNDNKIQVAENEFVDIEISRKNSIDKAISLATEKNIDLLSYIPEKFDGKQLNELSGQQLAAAVRFLELQPVVSDFEVQEAVFEEVEQQSIFNMED